MKQNQAPLKATLNQPDAAALYDKLAWVYDFWGHLTESKARDRCLELAQIENGEHVLEVAAGSGLAFQHLVRANPAGRNVGIDISRGMLARAERRLKKSGLSNYELAVCNALNIPEPENSFDLLLCNYMFDLLDEKDWGTVLREFHRVLKPDGKLVLANMTIGKRRGSGIYQRLYRLSPSLMGGCRGIHLSGPLKQNGFVVRRREYIQQLLFPSEVILASIGVS